MKPLAYQIRPTHYDDIIGQDHLVGQQGILRKMIDSGQYFSFILYGDPGIGKTTIANATCQMSKIPFYNFNASTDNKDKLKQIIADAKFNQGTFMVVDEIHRMKADIQDFLLPYLENGIIYMIGLTTVNPYHSVNPAIRSRSLIFRLNNLTEENLYQIIMRAKKHFIDQNQLAPDTILFPDSVNQYLVNISNGEIRTLINNFSMLATISLSETIDLNKAMSLLQKPNLLIDKNQDHYFDTLSGLQKSIRGSDVDASLHYLAKLIVSGDLVSISRRLLAIAYEDIGLANPTIGPRVKAALDSAKELGFPEARLPLSVIVIEMALSPKSNSAYLAIDQALGDLETTTSASLPLHLKNTYSFNPNQKSYLYPHDYPNGWVNQQYLPDPLVNRHYYFPKDSSQLEINLKKRLEQINQWKKENKN